MEFFLLDEFVVCFNMIDSRGVFKLGLVLQAEQAVLVEEWVKEQNRLLAKPGRLFSLTELTSECNAFISALRNAVFQSPPMVLSDARWSGVAHLLKLIASRRVEQGVTASEAAGFVLSLKRPLFAAVQRRCSAEPPDILVSLICLAAELLDQFASSAIELYQHGREVTLQQQRAELLALYERAQQAVRSRDEILAIVCHDLRNQLTQVLGSRTLYERVTENDAKEHLDAIMQRQAQSMLRLISDLLDSTAIEQGQLTINKEWVDPESVLNDTLELIAPMAERKAIRVLKEVSTGIPAVPCDAMRIGQVLTNLLSNAIKFTPAAGTVTVRVEKADSNVLFSVSDNGQGISSEDLQHLFKRYWRGRKDSVGVGLGLSIVNAIVMAHSGQIWVESQVGKGSTFFFTLPAANAQTCVA
jgi:signal transduction histidine kinase